MAARKPAVIPERRRSLTIEAIEQAIDADGGDRFRALQEKWFPLIEDAYRQEGHGSFRTHFGFSGAGNECGRAVWYLWRWAATKTFNPRMKRLVNRGHLEEARFMAMLEMIGVTIYDPPNGENQWRVSAYKGHAGSALDAVMWGIPDCPGEYLLGEFKTHNTKSFCDLVAKGSVAAAKPQHYTQMQLCMLTKGIHKCLYMAVNKNDDDLYTEIVEFNDRYAVQQIERAGRIIFSPSPPTKIGSAEAFTCKFCDLAEVCHYGVAPLEHCRTCDFSVPREGGDWWCKKHEMVLDKAAQMEGCSEYTIIPALDSPR